MNAPKLLANIAIIGAGRMGNGLALALTTRGFESVVFQRDWDPSAIRRATLVLLAVPDDTIPGLASDLASRDAIHDRQTVLHLSGVRDRTALDALMPTGAARGSFHPLQSVPMAERAPERLEGAYAAIEGDDRALATAEALAESLGMTPVRLPEGAKPAYHAAATFVSNYTVTLVAVAERLAMSAGIPPEIARSLYLPLLQGTVANIVAAGTEAALTGPVRRGDAKTVQTHLEALGQQDQALYRQLARATLELASTTQDPAKLNAIEMLLANARESSAAPNTEGPP